MPGSRVFIIPSVRPIQNEVGTQFSSFEDLPSAADRSIRFASTAQRAPAAERGRSASAAHFAKCARLRPIQSTQPIGSPPTTEICTRGECLIQEEARRLPYIVPSAVDGPNAGPSLGGWTWEKESPSGRGRARLS